MLNRVISSLDISALDQFKGVNRRGFEVVNAHPQFKVLNRPAHDVHNGSRGVSLSDAWDAADTGTGTCVGFTLGSSQGEPVGCIRRGSISTVFRETDRVN